MQSCHLVLMNKRKCDDDDDDDDSTFTYFSGVWLSWKL